MVPSRKPRFFFHTTSSFFCKWRIRYIMAQPWVSRRDWPVRAPLVVGEEEQGIGHVLHSGKHTVHGIPQHDVLHHFLRDAQVTGLLGDLLFHQRRFDEAGADGVGVNAVSAPSRAMALARPATPCLGEVVGFLQLGAHKGLDRTGEHDTTALAAGFHTAEGRPGHRNAPSA